MSHTGTLLNCFVHQHDSPIMWLKTIYNKSKTHSYKKKIVTTIIAIGKN